MTSLSLAKPRSWVLGLAVLATLIGVAAKLSLTSGELLPGVDGAYYWVQVRSLFEDFTLAFDDVPLVFWLQALISALVGDVELGVRLSDALLPALSAIPIYLILRTAKSIWVPALGILAVLLHPTQLYFFTGDFIKNSAAIPLVFLIGWLLHTWSSRSKLKTTVYLLICLSALALSHFGTLLLSVMLIAIWLVFILRNKPRLFWIKSAAVVLVSIGVVLLALALLVPARFERLVEFVTQPSTIFANPAWEMMFGPALGMIFGGRTDVVMIFSMVVGQIGSIALGFVLWKIRKTLSDSSLGLASAGLISAFLLSSPLIGMEWATRLMALSIVPLAIAAMVIWLAAERPAMKIVPAFLAIASLITSSVLMFAGLRQPIMTDEAYKDLKVVAQEFDFPENSIVVARHGVEFLVAWNMEVHVVQEASYQDVNLDSYDAVYYLEQVGSSQGLGVPNEQYGSGSKPPMGEAPGNPPTGKPPIGPKPTGYSTMETKASDLSLQGDLVYENQSFTLRQLR
jgi:hypothetical protein